jgi:endonuclease/exonuclease/phosphatase family metal-dependent hydrolase
MRIFWKRPPGFVLILLPAALCLLLQSACSVTPARVQKDIPPGIVATGSPDDPSEKLKLTGPLKLLNLNAAHGRKDGLNQMFIGKKKIRQNLDEMSAFLTRVDADVVALQEADGPSLWSGSFDHVALLARQANYPWHARASHASSWLYDYGTALLSRADLAEVQSRMFPSTPPTLTKGFLLVQVLWRPDRNSEDQIPVDIVSVHLDFSRSKVRKQQIIELADAIALRDNPVIILGDFNSEWSDEDSAVRELVLRSKLQVYRPEAEDLGTYWKNNRRLDWVLISDDLEFKSYSVLTDIMSDHYAVIAEVAAKSKGQANPDETKAELLNSQRNNGDEL